MEYKEGRRIMGEIIVIVGIGMLLVEVGEGRTPVLHEVGGDRFGWRLNVNFSDWAAHRIFYVGDWLYFGFDKQKVSVLEVNQTGYERCIENNYLTNITKGGRDVFNLTVARPYYFISGRGYCNRGIKLGIVVQNAPPDNSSYSLPPPSLPDDDDSFSKTTSSSSTTPPPTTIVTSHASTMLPSFFHSSHHHFLITLVFGLLY